MEFFFNCSKSIRCGSGLSGQIGQLGKEFLGGKTLIISDRQIIEIGLVSQALKSLNENKIAYEIFDGVTADPSLSVLQSAIQIARNKKIESVIGFGGGSSLDVAKLTALIVGSNEDINEAWGVDLAKGPRLPLILVPTTAGTGSEVTPVSIITVEDDEKRGVSSPKILPDLAILDATLTLGLPKQITAATGIDAMVHAIEAYTSKTANNNPLSKILATKALELLGANIEQACFNGRSFEARENMLIGSMMAGMAFANSPVAGVHALAYPIGGMFHIPHGLSNALILKEVMRFNAETCYQEYSELAPFIFSDLNEQVCDQTRSATLINRLGKLSETIGLQQKLRDVGIKQKDLPVMAEAAMKQTRLLVNNPREITQKDALEIYKAAW